MSHIHDIAIGNTTYLIEPTLYGAVTTNDNGATYVSVNNTFSNFELTDATGVTIYVKFPSTNTTNVTRLNINKTGLKNIHYEGNGIPANTLKADHTYALVYDGTSWQLVGDINTDTQIAYGNITTDGLLNTASSLVVTDSNKRITTGAVISSSVSTQSQSTTFLREDGIWAAPSYTGIQDNLTSSTNTTESLSAKQGYLLANGSARDDTKLPLDGGTMTGQIVLAKTGYKTNSTSGYSVNQYGNLKHLRSSSDDYFAITSNSETSILNIYWETGNIISTGAITATAFSGSGALLTDLNASNISSGTLSTDRLATSGVTSGSYGPSAAVTGSNNTTMNVPYITVDQYGRITSISDKVYTAVDTWREISDSLEGTSSSISASSKALGDLNTKVNGLLAAADAMIFKGTLGTNGTITTVPDGTSGKEYQAGYTYKIITDGTYAGIVCEAGDLLIAISDSTNGQTAINNAHWTVAQTNIDGAVTGPSSATNGNIPLFDGDTGKIIKNSSYSPSSFAAASHGLHVPTLLTSSSTAYFLRGDNAWSDTLEGLFKITSKNITVTIGSANSNWVHFTNNKTKPYYFDNQVNANGGFKVYDTTTTLTSSGLNISSSTAASNTTTGSIITAGGISTGAASYLTGSVHIVGTAASTPLIVRGISGSGTDGNRDTTATNQELYLNYNGGQVQVGFTETTAISTNMLKIAYNSDSSSTSTGALVVDGGVGIAKKLYVGGPIMIGGPDTAATTGYATANVGSNNYIAFYGVYGDGPATYNHSYIGESIYGAKGSANEKSELLLYHGNDVSTSSGLDRIRLFAASVDIQVYTSAMPHQSGTSTWNDIRATSGTQVANFKNGQVTITGNILPEANNTRALGSVDCGWNSVYLSNQGAIKQVQADTKNYTAPIIWLKNKTGWIKSTENDTVTYYTYQPQIGQCNLNGTDNLGTITILPYATDTSPWGGTVGLYITKDSMKLDNKVIPHTGNNTGSVGGENNPVYILNGEIKTCTAYADAVVAAADKIAVTESTEATSYIVSVKNTSGNNDSLVYGTLSVTNVISGQTISTTTLNIGTIGHNGYLTLYSNNQNGYTSTLQTPALTQSVTYTLPSAGGTIALITDKVAAAGVADKLTESDVGGASQPIYLAAGVATAGNTYAGGTAVTLNNSSCSSSTASFYAPTSGGAAGYILIGAGTTTEPDWYEGIALTGTALTNYKATFYGTAKSTSTSTGTLVVSGGIGTGADSYLQKSVHIVGSASDDPLIVRSISGCSTTGNRGSTADDTNQGLYLNYNGGPINLGKPNDAIAANIVYMHNTQESTSTSTGAVRIYGGASIAKSLWVGTKVAVNNNSITTFGTKGDGQIQLCSSSNYHTQLEFRKGTLSSTTNGYKSWMIGVNYSTELLSINSDYDSSGSQLTTYGHNILNLNPVSGFAEFTGGISTQELNLANTSLTKKVKLVWNETDESLQFIFI